MGECLKFCSLTNDQMYCICWLQKQFSDLIPRVLEVIKALALHDEVCILSSIWYDYFVYSFSFTNILTFTWKKHLYVVIYNQDWRWNQQIHLPHVAVILRWWKINRSNSDCSTKNCQYSITQSEGSDSNYPTWVERVSRFKLSESSPHFSSKDNYHFLMKFTGTSLWSYGDIW